MPVPGGPHRMIDCRRSRSIACAQRAAGREQRRPGRRTRRACADACARPAEQPIGRPASRRGSSSNRVDIRAPRGRCRAASYRISAAATATLSDSTARCIGNASARSVGGVDQPHRAGRHPRRRGAIAAGRAESHVGERRRRRAGPSATTPMPCRRRAARSRRPAAARAATGSRNVLPIAPRSAFQPNGFGGSVARDDAGRAAGFGGPHDRADVAGVLHAAQISTSGWRPDADARHRPRSECSRQWTRARAMATMPEGCCTGLIAARTLIGDGEDATRRALRDRARARVSASACRSRPRSAKATTSIGTPVASASCDEVLAVEQHRTGGAQPDARASVAEALDDRVLPAGDPFHAAAVIILPDGDCSHHSATMLHDESANPEEVRGRDPVARPRAEDRAADGRSSARASSGIFARTPSTRRPRSASVWSSRASACCRSGSARSR